MRPPDSNRRFIRIVSALWFGLLLCTSCQNPFFPPTGVPDESFELRSTPRGVIQQLRQAYTSRRLALFQDLFDQKSGDFRFYVPQQTIQDLPKLSERATLQTIDEDIPFIQKGVAYKYIGYADEREIHRMMFENAEAITWKIRLEAAQVDSVDSLIRIDTSYVTQIDSSTGKVDSVEVTDSVFLTTMYAVKTNETAELEISAAVVKTAFQENSHSFILGPQVFILKRDPNDQSLWVIDKWFQLEN